MMTAEQAYSTVQNNIETEANAQIEEIGKKIEDIVNVVNEPIFEMGHVMPKFAYPLVAKKLNELGYTVTMTDHSGGKVLATIGWLSSKKA